MAASRFASRFSMMTSRGMSRATTVARPMISTGSRRMVSSGAFNKSEGSNFRYSSLLAGAAGVGLATAVIANADGEKVDYNAVRESIREVLDNENYEDGSYGPVVVRLAWHASGTYDKKSDTGGSDGSTMRFSPESGHGANAGLAVARDLLEKVHKKHPNISYADLWTLAGAVAIEHMGGPKIPWRPGRSDAESGKACPPDGRLPDAAQGQDHVRDIFYRMGFNDQEIVALAGAHALGRCHTDRSGYDGPWTFAPTTFSNDYFVRLLEEDWKKRSWNGPEQYQDAGSKSLMMLPADMAFVRDPAFRKWVEIYAKDEDRFFKDFASAFGKLMSLGCKNLHDEEQSWWSWIFGN